MSKSRFKPYKGVSSNDDTSEVKVESNCFKPYKGVSSNDMMATKAMTTLVGFKPYKGVSSNISKLDLSGLEKSFKPYKGVSSNFRPVYFYPSRYKFQTL